MTNEHPRRPRPGPGAPRIVESNAPQQRGPGGSSDPRRSGVESSRRPPVIEERLGRGANEPQPRAAVGARPRVTSGESRRPLEPSASQGPRHASAVEDTRQRNSGEMPAAYCEVDGLPVEIDPLELGPAGLFVQTTAPLAVDSEVDVFVRVGAIRFEASGHVVQSISCADAQATGRLPGYALLFTHLADDARAQLAAAVQLVSSRPPPGRGAVRNDPPPARARRATPRPSASPRPLAPAGPPPRAGHSDPRRTISERGPQARRSLTPPGARPRGSVPAGSPGGAPREVRPARGTPRPEPRSSRPSAPEERAGAARRSPRPEPRPQPSAAHGARAAIAPAFDPAARRPEPATARPAGDRGLGRTVPGRHAPGAAAEHARALAAPPIDSTWPAAVTPTPGTRARTPEPARAAARASNPATAGTLRGFSAPPDASSLRPPVVANQPSAAPAVRSAVPGAPDERELLGRLQAELATLSSQTPWAILGISQGADPSAARAAFFAASKRCHPHVYARYGLPEIKDTVTALFIAYKRAFTTMTKTSKPPRGGAGLAANAAQSGRPVGRTSDPGTR